MNISRIIRCCSHQIIVPSIFSKQSIPQLNRQTSYIQTWRHISSSEEKKSIVPKRFQPYVKLMRLDRPTGALLLLWPSWWGIALATSPGCLPSPYYLTLFTTGAILMRGAGCVVNDLWDRDFDACVSRTKDRPLASGQLSTKQAFRFLAIQLTASACILFSFDWTSIVIGASSLILVGTYPWFKRITYWPQLVLGLTFNWGVLLGYSVVSGGTLFPSETVIPLYVAGICWTMIYDTIYAHQDKLDDLRIGVKSTAIKFGEKTKYWLSGFSTGMISSLVFCGLSSGQTWPFYLSVAAVAGHLGYQINSLDIDDPSKCWSLFKKNSHIGLLLFLGIVASTLLKQSDDDKEKKNTFVKQVNLTKCD